MNDYKELINALRHEELVDCDFCGYPCSEKNEDCIVIQAADAIEQFVKERDAAVADLKDVLQKRSITMNVGHVVTVFDRCDICVGTHDMCDTCFLGNKWEWRGVKGDEVRE